MLRPSPNHGTQRLPNDDDDEMMPCSYWPCTTRRNTTPRRRTSQPPQPEKRRRTARPLTWELRQCDGSTSRKGGKPIRLRQPHRSGHTRSTNGHAQRAAPIRHFSRQQRHRETARNKHS